MFPTGGWMRAYLDARAVTLLTDLGPDDPAYAEYIEKLLPDVTLIGDEQGAILRCMVYGVTA